MCFTGPDPFWQIKSEFLHNTHRFRVRAYNSYGWSEFSDPSIQFYLSYQEPITSFMAPFGALSAAVIIFASLCTVCVIKCKKSGFGFKSNNCKLQDSELDHLRCENLVETRNPLYVSSADYTPTDADIAALPKIKRDQITLIKFLGSGAFGEVFEGTAKNLEETKVAIKTLRKGATLQEKMEFLKEALLMSNFKHEHILRLIGVCLDNNPTLIIMELMEGKDLLSYLRSHRPTKGNPSSLNLKDLLSISVDVTKGCKYLEDMHFVHRDLAARNCLVSCLDPKYRIVKIGDFGLARDIYRNDYYKKEGEGLLPVRWMAPECLVDGLFSSQSDVWAFGVLLWEIMSLGQQPYPARTNVDVLHYVRGGGRLNRPANCSHLMYSLMLKCWSFQSDKRPSFIYCLQILNYLKSISKPLTLQIDTDYAGWQDSSSSNFHTELEFTFQDQPMS
ncbi:hypothetical protein M8J76_011270 [Diaphorina citri]|nr:hypothetical protein M8J76_011270 [Diaphorina citri]